jgi:hypothetical protein
MKKLYSGLLLFLPLLSVAQPTINQADLPTIGTTFIFGTDVNYSALAPVTGPAQTWDFSSLLYPEIDSTVFDDPFSTPYQTDFQNSNLASHDVASDAYAYYTSDVNGFYLNGVESAFGKLEFFPPSLFVPVPFTFGNNKTSESRSQIDIPDISTGSTVRSVSYVHSVFKANGYGTLITPNGTYNDVLQISIADSSFDSTYIDMGLGFQFVPGSDSLELSYSQKFFTSGNAVNYIMGIDLDSSGTNAVRSEFLADHILGVPSVADKKNTVAYPNPASTNISFNNINENTKIVIYDNTGKEVYRSKGSAFKNINVQKLNNGVYHYEISNSDKNQTGSFVVQH